MGSGKPTIKTIADHFEISHTTVSRALSGNGRVSPELRKSIRAYALEIGYISPSQSSVLATPNGKSGNIAVVLPKDMLYVSNFFHECLLGIAEYLSGHNYETLLVLCDSNEVGPIRGIVQKGKVEGFIFTRTVENDKSIRFLHEEGIPVVAVGSGEKYAVNIDADHWVACRELTSHLLHVGCKRIAYLGGDATFLVNQHRFEGYAKGLLDHSRPVEPRLLFRNLVNRMDCKIAVETAIQNRAECILCCDEVICEWVIDILAELGLSVPDNLLLASCNDSHFLSGRTPSVTSIHIDVRHEGALAGEAMIRLLNDEPTDTMLVEDYSIRLRQSTRKNSDMM